MEGSLLAKTVAGMPPYELALSKSDAHGVWNRRVEAIHPILERGYGRARVVLSAVEDSKAFSRIWERRELIRVFVGTELDSAAPGKRGLGRMTIGVGGSWGRFATVYPEALAKGDRVEWGRLIEEVVLCGCLVGAGVNPLRVNGPFAPVERTDDEAFRLWVPVLAEGYYPESTALKSLLDQVVFEGGTASGARFVEAARSAGLIRGLFKIKRGAEIRIRLLLYAGAGIALFDVLTARWNDEDLIRNAVTGGGWSALGGAG